MKSLSVKSPAQRKKVQTANNVGMATVMVAQLMGETFAQR
jgi:hypothetical protein